MHDQTGTGSLLHAITVLALMAHVAGGGIGLVSGTIAVIARKGGRRHRTAGKIFVASMLVMAVFAIYLGFVMPEQRTNVFIGAFAAYLISTGWVAVRRGDGPSGLFERACLLVALCLCAPFVILSCQLITGLPPLLRSAVPFEGPVLVAIYVFTAVLVIAAIGDAKLVWSGGISGVPRVSRHLWRMCLGLALAAGSGFTNGLARLLPGPYHVPASFFFPQFVPIVLLVFWLLRVRTAAWRRS